MKDDERLPPHLRGINAGRCAAARQRARLTQAEAATQIYLGKASRWAEYETGLRRPDPARFELFLLLNDLHPIYRLVRKRPQPGE
jgi:transcriptional regulator with XRE-family HTH domain